MGQCTQALFFYGFFIQGEELVALRSALGSRDEPEKPASEEPLVVSDFGVIDLRDMISNWLDAHDNRAFSVYSNYDENGSGGAEIVVSFMGEEGGSVEKWGYQASGSKFEPVGDPWDNKEFLKLANQVFKRLGEDPVVKEAKITIEPMWIHGLDIG